MVSIAGYTHFFGQHGKGQVAVPFNKIKRVEFSGTGTDFSAAIILDDGSTMQTGANKDMELFGHTSYGNFKILLGDVKTIIIERQILSAGTGS